MKRCLSFFLFLGAMLRGCLTPLPAADVVYNVSDFTGQAVVSKAVISPITAPTIIDGVFVVIEPRTYTNLSSGTFTVTNMLGPIAYRAEFYGPWGISTVTNFIPSTTNTIDAADYTTNAVFMERITAYSQSTADARFVLRTNGTSTNQTLISPKFSGTAQLGWIWTSSGTNGAGSWQPAETNYASVAFVNTTSNALQSAIDAKQDHSANLDGWASIPTNALPTVSTNFDALNVTNAAALNGQTIANDLVAFQDVITIDASAVIEFTVQSTNSLVLIDGAAAVESITVFLPEINENVFLNGKGREFTITYLSGSYGVLVLGEAGWPINGDVMGDGGFAVGESRTYYATAAGWWVKSKAAPAPTNFPSITVSNSIAVTNSIEVGRGSVDSLDVGGLLAYGGDVRSLVGYYISGSTIGAAQFPEGYDTSLAIQPIVNRAIGRIADAVDPIDLNTFGNPPAVWGLFASYAGVASVKDQLLFYTENDDPTNGPYLPVGNYVVSGAGSPEVNGYYFYWRDTSANNIGATNEYDFVGFVGYYSLLTNLNSAQASAYSLPLGSWVIVDGGDAFYYSTDSGSTWNVTGIGVAPAPSVAMGNPQPPSFKTSFNSTNYTGLLSSGTIEAYHFGSPDGRGNINAGISNVIATNYINQKLQQDLYDGNFSGSHDVSHNLLMGGSNEVHGAHELIMGHQNLVSDDSEVIGYQPNFLGNAYNVIAGAMNQVYGSVCFVAGYAITNISYACVLAGDFIYSSDGNQLILGYKVRGGPMQNSHYWGVIGDNITFSNNNGIAIGSFIETRPGFVLGDVITNRANYGFSFGKWLNNNASYGFLAGENATNTAGTDNNSFIIKGTNGVTHRALFTTNAPTAGAIPRATDTIGNRAEWGAMMFAGSTNIGSGATNLVIAIGHTMPSTNYTPAVIWMGSAVTNVVPYVSARTTTNFTVQLLNGITGGKNLNWSVIYSP